MQLLPTRLGLNRFDHNCENQAIRMSLVLAMDEVRGLGFFQLHSVRELAVLDPERRVESWSVKGGSETRMRPS
jgi:hypothetical protein